MSKPSVSKRLLKVPASPIRKLVPYANDAKKRGVKIHHLNIGDPDIETPDVMLKVLNNWKIKTISYSQSQGQPEFLEAIKTYYHKLGYAFINTENLQVTTGGSEAISMAMFAVCEPGDEIITFEPFYANYNSYAAVNGVKIIPIRTVAKNGFHLPSQKEIEDKISKKTKAILYCNPNNPTGTVYTQNEIKMLVEVAKKYNLFIISDEVYREFTYDGKKHISLLSFFKQIPNQAILLDSLSKRYSLCGARLGILSTLNKDVMTGALRIAQGRLSSGFVDQLIASKLTQVKPSYFVKIKKEYQNRRDILYKGLLKIPGIFVTQPEGAFYCIVSLPVKNTEEFCKYLLTDFNLNGETVMFAPARGFYASTNAPMNQVRIAYVLNVKSLQKSLSILKSALNKYLH